MTTTTGQPGRRLESLSLLMGASGFLAGGVVALLLLEPPAQLFGKDSIGEAAALMGGAVSGLAFLTVMLALVGVIPVNRSLFWHNQVTYGAIGAFAVLLIAVPFLFRRLTGGFFGVTAVVAAILAAAAWLNRGTGYLNTTAFEIVSVGSMFIWLILFIRSVAAEVADIPQVDRGHDRAAVTNYS